MWSSIFSSMSFFLIIYLNPSGLSVSFSILPLPSLSPLNYSYFKFEFVSISVVIIFGFLDSYPWIFDILFCILYIIWFWVCFNQYYALSSDFHLVVVPLLLSSVDNVWSCVHVFHKNCTSTLDPFDLGWTWWDSITCIFDLPNCFYQVYIEEVLGYTWSFHVIYSRRWQSCFTFV